MRKKTPVIDENLGNVEEIIIPPEKREKTLNKLRRIIKTEHHKISRLLDDSALTKFLTKNRLQ